MVASSFTTKKARFRPNRDLGDKEDDGQHRGNSEVVSHHLGQEGLQTEIYVHD